MLKSYNVYLKNGGTLKLELFRFEYDKERFTIYDSKNVSAPDAFLSFNHVAALIPEEQPESELWFKVHLKTGHSFDVAANYFDVADPPSIKFFRSNTEQHDEEIEGIYVARSEVVAIMPREGLERDW